MSSSAALAMVHLVLPWYRRTVTIVPSRRDRFPLFSFFGPLVLPQWNCYPVQQLWFAERFIPTPDSRHLPNQDRGIVGRRGISLRLTASRWGGAIGNREGAAKLRFWDVATGRPLPVIPGADGYVRGFKPDSKTFILQAGSGSAEPSSEHRIFRWNEQSLTLKTPKSNARDDTPDSTALALLSVSTGGIGDIVIL